MRSGTSVGRKNRTARWLGRTKPYSDEFPLLDSDQGSDHFMSSTRRASLESLALVRNTLDLGIISFQVFRNQLANLSRGVLFFRWESLEGFLEPQKLLGWQLHKIRHPILWGTYSAGHERDGRCAFAFASVSHVLLALRFSLPGCVGK